MTLDWTDFVWMAFIVAIVIYGLWYRQDIY